MITLTACLLACLLTLAGCAGQPAGNIYPPSDISSTSGASYGTIVDMRPFAARPGAAAAGDPRSYILGAVGSAVVGGATPRGATRGEAVEFIVRADDGQTISVVQSDEVGLRRGERVLLTRAPRTRIARAGS